MMISGFLSQYSSALNDRAKAMDNLLKNEVHGGDWDDDVGASFIAYTEELCRQCEKFLMMAEKIASIEKALDDINLYADEEKLENIKQGGQK